jgi:hypothetical protein
MPGRFTSQYDTGFKNRQERGGERERRHTLEQYEASSSQHPPPMRLATGQARTEWCNHFRSDDLTGRSCGDPQPGRRCLGAAHSGYAHSRVVNTGDRVEGPVELELITQGSGQSVQVWEEARVVNISIVK